MVKAFFNEVITIFSEPKAYKKVIVSFVLGFCVALVANVSKNSSKNVLSVNDYTLAGLAVFLWLFVALWCVSAGGFSINTFGREVATGAWGALIHGLALGNEQTGTWFFTIFSFVCMGSLIPFILGFSYAPIFKWFEDVANKKKRNLAIVRNIDDANHG